MRQRFSWSTVNITSMVGRTSDPDLRSAPSAVRLDDAEPPIASVIISTYNRAEALVATLAALDQQQVASGSFEVIVVDDGSRDATSTTLPGVSTGYPLRIFTHRSNRGVSAGRNTAIRQARGAVLILLSDDLLVSTDFVRLHLETLERFPRSWVVGGFRQLDAMTRSPFGRYLDALERGFDDGRKTRPIAPNLWEMAWPTARNLSLPRTDLDALGLFDERFRTCCEDQDLAERATARGIRFIYNAEIDCLHNDQAADLERYCRFQERGARDTVLFCAKHPERHGDAAIARVNGRLSLQDGPGLTTRKVLKMLLSRPRPTRALMALTHLGERCRAPERWLFAAYRAAIGLGIFRGWRQGLRDNEHAGSLG